MDPGERPFPCKIDGCRLSFTTEDHLNVHRRNHDRLLNLQLPNKSNLFADQTPTPTRLIGKCDEVGLFEDLQNVNPFEETFRRAVEEKSSGSGESSNEKDVPDLGLNATGDETLHTPHVFPLLERRDSHKLSKLIISRSSSRRDDTPVLVTSQSEPVPDSRQSTKRKQRPLVASSNKKPTVNILPKCTPSSQPVIIISCETEKALSVVKTATPLHPVKAKLKKYLARNGCLAADETGQPSSSIATTSTLSSQKKAAAVVPEVKTAPGSQVESKDPKHERWKAAAKRYRTRVKQNQSTLHQKNLELEEENLRLRTELGQLRHALSLHKDCSVTRALAARTINPANAAGTSVVFVPLVGQHVQQPLTVEPMIGVAPAQPVGAVAAINNDNPVYIILGGINTVAEKTKSI